MCTTAALSFTHRGRLGLARSYALQGDTAKARAGYQDFPTLWKDADPDIPILRAAKADYVKLQWLTLRRLELAVGKRHRRDGAVSHQIC